MTLSLLFRRAETAHAYRANRHLAAISALTAATACATAPAVAGDRSWEAQCEARLQPAHIAVTTEPSQLRYDFSQTIQALTLKAPLKTAGTKTLGLTVAQMRTSLKWSANYLVDDKTGRACMRPQLEVGLSVNPQQVYIAREFPQGSCAFNHIAEHELRHVRVNQARLEQVADQLKVELQSALGGRVFYGEHSQLRQQLEQAVTKDWLPWVQQQLNAVDAQHQLIDSPQEYAQNQTACNGEIARVLRAQR